MSNPKGLGPFERDHFFAGPQIVVDKQGRLGVLVGGQFFVAFTTDSPAGLISYEVDIRALTHEELQALHKTIQNSVRQGIFITFRSLEGQGLYLRVRTDCEPYDELEELDGEEQPSSGKDPVLLLEDEYQLGDRRDSVNVRKGFGWCLLPKNHPFGLESEGIEALRKARSELAGNSKITWLIDEALTLAKKTNQ